MEVLIVAQIRVLEFACLYWSPCSAWWNDAAALWGPSEIRLADRWTCSEWCVLKDGGDNRPTWEAVRKSEPSGSGPESTGRLAGAWPQRRSRLCPQTAVHPLISDGSELFWSKIFHQRRDTTDWQVVSGQIATAVHHGWKKNVDYWSTDLRQLVQILTVRVPQVPVCAEPAQSSLSGSSSTSTATSSKC